MAEDISDVPNAILKVASILLIGVIFLSGLNSGLGSQMIDSQTLTLTSQPADGETVTIGSSIFEFDTGDGTVSGHIPVIIGSTVLETIGNLRGAM